MVDALTNASNEQRSEEEQLESDQTRTKTNTPSADSFKAALDETMSVEQIIAFCLPPRVQHAKSTTLLYILGEYGPLTAEHSYNTCLCSACQKHIDSQRKTDELCKVLFARKPVTGTALLATEWLCGRCRVHCKRSMHLKSGRFGATIVNEITLKEMGAQIDRDDVLEAFNRKNALSFSEQLAFLDKIGRDYNITSRHYTREEIPSLFNDVPKDESGMMDFYEVKRTIAELRAERVDRLRQMYPKLVTKGKPKMPNTKKKEIQYSTVLDELDLNNTVRGSVGKQVGSRILSSHSHTVANLEDQKCEGVIDNVMLIRSTIKQTSDWNRNF